MKRRAGTPEYVKCIKSPFVDERGGMTLCGKKVTGHDFMAGLDHVYCHTIGQGRLLACSACVDKAIGVLEHSRDTEAKRDPQDQHHPKGPPGVTDG